MKERKFIKRCIELTGKGLGGSIKILYRVMKPRDFIKVSPACLTAFIALNGFALALVVFLAYFISKDSWSSRLPECSGPRTTPSFLQIQVFGDGENSTRDVVVDSEKNPWVGELVNALRQIQQAPDNDDGSVSNVVVDPKENPWIDKLINTLRDAGKRQSGTPVAGTNFIGNVVIDRDKNPWVDELLDVLRSAAETQVTDATVREHIEKQIHCADDENSSAERPESEAVELDAVVPGLSARIQKQMGCADSEHLKVSGFIRFSNNDDSINKIAKKRIDDFMAGDKRAGGWDVIGFASEAGEKERNRELSRQRACAVKKYICENNGRSQSDAGCKACPKDKGKEVEAGYKCTVSGNRETEFLACFLGEEHFINGVADSRSVVIVACKTKE